MKTYLSVIAVALLALVATSCGNQAAIGNNLELNELPPMTVDEIMRNPGLYVDSIVTVEGRCVHVCRGAGSIIYIACANDTVLLRCTASSSIGGAFGDTIKEKPLKFKGMLREERLNEEGIHDLEEQYCMHLQMLADDEIPDSVLLHGKRRCDYERLFRGQFNIIGFEESMADYRAKIARRKATDGKDYLPFYFLETIAVNE